MDWRVLVVDDTMAEDVVALVEGNKVLEAPDSIQCVTCTDFASAIQELVVQRFDLVILDLKDEAADDGEAHAGQEVYTKLKNLRFVPIVFYTGFAYKVKELESPFVRVVTKGENPAMLRSAIKEAFDTKLPQLVKHIEEEQRKYMWESAEQIWTSDISAGDTTDLVYLLARRLANLLQGDVIRNFLASNGGGIPQANKMHAVELYVWPPVSPNNLFGDILRMKTDTGADEYFVVLTPSCDFAHGKVESILLARCKTLPSTSEAQKIQTHIAKNEAPSKSAVDELMKLLGDRSGQVDRFKYLPGTSFLPDLVMDFQALIQVSYVEIKREDSQYQRLASLDSPFAEALQAKMARYYGRIGTPDLDTNAAYDRFVKTIPKGAAVA